MTNQQNELGEEIIENGLSLNDMLGWMEKKNNQKWNKAVRVLIKNRKVYEEAN